MVELAETDWTPIESPYGKWLERFTCDEPPTGIAFRVIEDEWEDLDPPRRTIHKVELVSSALSGP